MKSVKRRHCARTCKVCRLGQLSEAGAFEMALFGFLIIAWLDLVL